MTTLAAETLLIDMVGDCTDEACLELADQLRTLDVPRYRNGVALMPVPASLEDWRAEHRTARKRADRCKRLGYRFERVDLSQYDDDVYAINTSLPERQGRPMSDGYRKRHHRSRLPDYPCQQHYIRMYGVLHDERLVAYLTLYHVGELRLVSMILGHGDHLRADVMFLLFEGLVADQAGGGGYLYYNRWGSGQNGLRFYKARVGFDQADVRWSW